MVKKEIRSGLLIKGMNTTYTLIVKPKGMSQFKVQAPNSKSQIQKGKEEIGIWAVTKFTWATTHPTPPHNFLRV